MKKRFILVCTGMLLVGCNEKLPSECKELISRMEAHANHLERMNAPKGVIASAKAQSKNFRRIIRQQVKRNNRAEMIEMCQQTIKVFNPPS